MGSNRDQIITDIIAPQSIGLQSHSDLLCEISISKKQTSTHLTYVVTKIGQ
jgi:hypothetical protein